MSKTGDEELYSAQDRHVLIRPKRRGPHKLKFRMKKSLI